MKYSLRSLMIVVTLVCVALGTGLGWVKYEQAKLRHKAEAYRTLSSKNVILAGPIGGWPRPSEQMQTWRGDETLDYIEVCRIMEAPYELNETDVTMLSSAFPKIREVQLIECPLPGAVLRQLASLPSLEKFLLCSTPVADEDRAWIEEHFPKVKIEIIQSRKP